MKNLIFFLFLFPFYSYAQNVGVGTENPTEKLEVNGIIFTTQGGIKFPDGSIQTTAYQPGTNGMMQSGLSGMVVEFSPDADIQGPAMDALITDGVNILSASDGISIGGGSLPSFQDLSITRISDEHSTQIFKLLTNGTTFAHVELFYLKYNPNMALYYIEQIHRYENCKFTSYSMGGSAGGETPTENVSISFTQACFRSYIFDPLTGDPTGNFNDSCWDLADNDDNCTCTF